jgi:putative ABC transport system ATP-binding protein
LSLIDLRDAYKIYNEGYENEVRALCGVSLRVERGEFLCIVGASGSGKSTLMNMLGCLDIPTYGEYFLDGQDVGELSDRALSKIRNKEVGFVFQGFSPHPSAQRLRKCRAAAHLPGNRCVKAPRDDDGSARARQPVGQGAS